MKLLGSVFLILSLSILGCATSQTVKIGDEYLVLKEGGTPVLGQTFHLSDLKAQGLREANETCEKQEKMMEVVKEDQVPMSIGIFARYELRFKCI